MVFQSKSTTAPPIPTKFGWSHGWLQTSQAISGSRDIIPGLMQATAVWAWLGELNHVEHCDQGHGGPTRSARISCKPDMTKSLKHVQEKNIGILMAFVSPTSRQSPEKNFYMPVAFRITIDHRQLKCAPHGAGKAPRRAPRHPKNAPSKKACHQV